MHGSQTTKIIPQNREQNGMTELLSRTVMNVVRSVFSTTIMNLVYWTYAAIDVVFKQNLMEHAITGRIPFHAYIGKHEKLSRVHVFGKLGKTPSVPMSTKFQDRGKIVRYMGMDGTRHVWIQTQKRMRIETFNGDLKPVIKHSNATQNTQCAFVSFLQNLTVVSIVLSPGTTQPVQASYAFRYSDAKLGI